MMTEAQFAYQTQFHKRIGLRSSSRLLRNCTCRFEVLWTPIGGKEVSMGTLAIDLAQFALPPPKRSHLLHRHKSGSSEETQVANQPVSYALRSRTNSLLTVRLGLEYVSGDADYEVPEFTAPALNGAQGVGSAAFGNDREAKISKGVADLRETVADTLLRECNDEHQDPRWFDLDALLIGENVRVVRQSAFAEFKKRGIKPLATDDASHKRGTPYAETEIRESFVTWKIS